MKREYQDFRARRLSVFERLGRRSTIPGRQVHFERLQPSSFQPTLEYEQVSEPGNQWDRGVYIAGRSSTITIQSRVTQDDIISPPPTQSHAVFSDSGHVQQQHQHRRYVYSGTPDPIPPSPASRYEPRAYAPSALVPAALHEYEPTYRRSLVEPTRSCYAPNPGELVITAGTGSVERRVSVPTRSYYPVVSAPPDGRSDRPAVWVEYPQHAVVPTDVDPAFLRPAQGPYDESVPKQSAPQSPARTPLDLEAIREPRSVTPLGRGEPSSGSNSYSRAHSPVSRYNRRRSSGSPVARDRHEHHQQRREVWRYGDSYIPSYSRLRRADKSTLPSAGSTLAGGKGSSKGRQQAADEKEEKAPEEEAKVRAAEEGHSSSKDVAQTDPKSSDQATSDDVIEKDFGSGESVISMDAEEEENEIYAPDFTASTALDGDRAMAQHAATPSGGGGKKAQSRDRREVVRTEDGDRTPLSDERESAALTSKARETQRTSEEELERKQKRREDLFRRFDEAYGKHEKLAQLRREQEQRREEEQGKKAQENLERLGKEEERRRKEKEEPNHREKEGEQRERRRREQEERERRRKEHEEYERRKKEQEARERRRREQEEIEPRRKELEERERRIKEQEESERCRRQPEEFEQHNKERLEKRRQEIGELTRRMTEREKRRIKEIEESKKGEQSERREKEKEELVRRRDKKEEPERAMREDERTRPRPYEEAFEDDREHGEQTRRERLKETVLARNEEDEAQRRRTEEEKGSHSSQAEKEENALPGMMQEAQEQPRRVEGNVRAEEEQVHRNVRLRTSSYNPPESIKGNQPAVSATTKATVSSATGDWGHVYSNYLVHPERAPSSPLFPSSASVSDTRSSSVGGASNDPGALPYPWLAIMSSKGDIYYYNSMTGESTWQRPRRPTFPLFPELQSLTFPTDVNEETEQKPIQSAPSTTAFGTCYAHASSSTTQNTGSSYGQGILADQASPAVQNCGISNGHDKFSDEDRPTLTYGTRVLGQNDIDDIQQRTRHGHGSESSGITQDAPQSACHYPELAEASEDVKIVDPATKVEQTEVQTNADASHGSTCAVSQVQEGPDNEPYTASKNLTATCQSVSDSNATSKERNIQSNNQKEETIHAKDRTMHDRTSEASERHRRSRKYRPDERADDSDRRNSSSSHSREHRQDSPDGRENGSNYYYYSRGFYRLSSYYPRRRSRSPRRPGYHYRDYRSRSPTPERYRAPRRHYDSYRP